MASRLVWVGCASLAILLAIVFLWPPSPPSPPPAPSFFTLSEARLVQYGGLPSAYARLEGNGANASLYVVADALSAAPARRVLLLTGPWSGASHLESLRQFLSDDLRPAGWTVEMRPLAALSREREGRYIMVPAGAWPQDLLQRWNETLSPSDTLIYLGVKDDLTLDGQGLVHSGGVPAFLMQDGVPLTAGAASFSPSSFASPSMPDATLLSSPNGAAVWRIAHTLDELDAGALASSLSGQMLQPADSISLAHSQTDYTSGQWSSVLPLPEPAAANSISPTASSASSPPNAAWLRLRLYDSGHRLIRLWDTPLAPSSGVIDAPQQAIDGQSVSLQFRLRPQPTQNEQVAYELHLYSPDGQLWASQALGNSSIGPSVDANASNGSTFSPAWVGSWVQKRWPSPGLTRLEVSDQFGRSYAQAVVQVPNYQVKALDGDGFTRRFLLLADGQPISSSVVEVRRDNVSAPSRFALSDGLVSISSSWSEGPHTLHFAAGNAQLDYTWSESAGGAWGVFWRWGIPGVALCALLILLLRQRPPPAYKVVVPAWPARPSQRLEMTPSQLRPLVSQAMARVQHGAAPSSSSARLGKPSAAIQASDLVYLLQHPLDSSNPVYASPESVETALQSMAAAGHLSRWGEYYCWPHQTNSVRELALQRLLRDRLMENGIRLQFSKAGLMADSTGRRWLIWQNQTASEISRARPTHLLFADQKEQEEFTRILAADGSAPSARLQLSLQLGRLHLACIGQPPAN